MLHEGDVMVRHRADDGLNGTVLRGSGNRRRAGAVRERSVERTGNRRARNRERGATPEGEVGGWRNLLHEAIAIAPGIAEEVLSICVAGASEEHARIGP